MAQARAHNELERVIHLAEEEAHRCHDLLVGTDRVLSVIVRMAKQGKYRGAFKKFIMASVGPILQKLQKLPLQSMHTDSDPKPVKTPSLEETIRFAREEARKMMGQGILSQNAVDGTVNKEIGIDYLVLGMLRKDRTYESAGTQILYSLGLTFDRAREIVKNHQLREMVRKTMKKAEKRKARDVINNTMHTHRILRKKSNVIVGGKGCAKWRVGGDY